MLKTQLTPEQSAKLIELGVSPERASKRNSSVAYGNGARGIMKVPETPIFTLTDLVSPLPKKITFGQRTNCRLKLQPIVSSKDRISEVWQACYLHTRSLLAACVVSGERVCEIRENEKEIPQSRV